MQKFYDKIINFLLKFIFTTSLEVNEEALICLNSESLKELIPKIRTRVKFSAKPKAYQLNMNTICLKVKLSSLNEAEVPFEIQSAQHFTEAKKDVRKYLLFLLNSKGLFLY